MDRRRFLLGAGGAVVGLPLLESFGGRRAVAQEVPTPGFLAVFRQANGVQQALQHAFTGVGEPENFWPRTPGPLTADNVAGRALDELTGHLPQLAVVSGIATAMPGIGCAHTAACNALLTAARVERFGASEETHALGASIDSFLAERLQGAGHGPLFLQAGPPEAWSAAALSYAGPRMRRNPDFNPLSKYHDLVGLSVPDDPAGRQLVLQRRSVNDLVRAQMARVLAHPRLSASDRRRLEMHREHIRDTELRLANACALSADAEASLEATTAESFGVGKSALLWNDHRALHQVARLHVDLAAFALACGLTRVAVISVGGYNNATRYELDGLPGGGMSYHKISHRSATDGVPSQDGATVYPEIWRQHHQIDRLHLRDYAYFLDRLATLEDARGPLLPQGATVYLSDMAAGSHSDQNLPVVCAGGANGFLRTGVYLDARAAGGSWVPHNKLLNTLINACGVRKPSGALWDDFGDASLARGVIAAMMAGSVRA